MAKDKSEKKEKKEKKEKHAEKNGISKSKKEKRLKQVDAVVPEVLAGNDDDGDVDMSAAVVDVKSKVVVRPVGALVPFANPLADEKACKKVLKSVKKAGKQKALKRGVKEVVKVLRKSPPATPSSLASNTPFGIVVLAADISPMDVISHLPVLCEDQGVQYVYVPSRAELGAAGSTKRPTSVVLVARELAKDRRMEKAKEAREKGGDKMDVDVKEDGKGDEEDWGETYAELVKIVRKAGRDVRI